MANLIVPKTAQLTQLAELIAGDLTGATLHLFSNDIAPDVDTIKTDLTECTFTGYAASAAIVWGAENQNAQGLAESIGDMKTFQCTGTAVTETAYGAYILSAGGGTPLLAAWRFDNPKAFTGPTSVLGVVPVFTYGSQVTG